MNIKTTILTIALLPAAAGLSAQMPGMPHAPGDMPGMTGSQEMMMGAMMGHGMMGSEAMGRMMGQGMGLMGTGGPAPSAILRMQGVLELTDDQIAKLEAVRDAHADPIRNHMTAAMGAHRTAQAAIEGDAPDFGAYEAALRQAAEQMVEAHVAMARAAADAREILTPGQRERLQQGMGMMEGMMGDGQGHGGTHGPPMSPGSNAPAHGH